ncbi:transglycosylase SLT domain-containing protein [Solihabitans fulvus]|uniref:Transglycosylase SLT domain-containing protein n=1 Tax=Solihabitans fulvus TaxID=1892852 RepID=A0A5B2XAK7_9PSEU|nr:transglycosylase SLT domain-containing protein [Solihabitans fulvus]KAA2260101.1 transglycosylase SLT domain-containing protein [Solihabitans fulvus]
MSAKDEVAGLPGGAALAALADKVDSAQPDSVREIANQLTTAAGKCDESDTAVGKSVAQLDGAWEGKSAQGFTTYMADFTKAGGSVKDALTNGATALNTAAGALQTAKDSINRICEDLLTRVRALRSAEKDDADKSQHDAAISRMCAEAVSDAQPKITEVEQALGTALGTINGLPGAIAPKFSTMADPNTQAFTPAPGKKVEWTAKPAPTTGTSGADGSAPITPPQDHGNGSGSGSGSGGDSGGSGSGNSGSGHGGGGHGGGGGGGGTDGGGGGGLGPSGGPPASGPPPGNVQDWIKQAIEILRANGVNVSDADINTIWSIIQHESGGDPHAINNWDSNAAAGHPSKGLMQCIDSTFQAHKLAGHDDIWNPVDNIIAGVKYSVDRYGGLGNVPGVKALHGGGSYVGY